MATGLAATSRHGSDDSGGRPLTVLRLRRLRHQRRDLGFLAARVLGEPGFPAGWLLHVEAPADLDEFRDHLASGAAMDLTMVTREGDYLRGEAFVASVSESVDAATLVTLCGAGPLRLA